jgi:hypothetical protein
MSEPNPDPQPRIDALFILACGCILDGCSDSVPARQFFNGDESDGKLICGQHTTTNILINVITTASLEPQ